MLGGNGGRRGPQGPIMLNANQPISHEELQKRQVMEMDVVLLSAVQKCLAVTADTIGCMKTDEKFVDFPKRKMILENATKLHGSFLEKQLSMLTRINKQFKAMEPFGGKPPVEIMEV